MRLVTTALILMTFVGARQSAQTLDAAFCDMPPLISHSGPGSLPDTSRRMMSVKGMMVAILHDIVTKCYGAETTTAFTDKASNQWDLENNSNETHFCLPITRTALRESFYGQFENMPAFIPVFESPGVLYISAKGYQTTSSMSAIISAWPLILLIFLSSGLIGCLVWICERLFATGEFPEEISRGLPESMWWSLVTMTTVGYGDRKPSSVIGRILASFWMLVGIVIVSLFTATLTSGFGAEGSEDIEIRGHRVGVVNGSITEEVAYMYGADPVVYPSAEDLLPTVSKDPSLHGFLLESFSAQFHTKIILKEELLILKLFPHPLVHGILTREPNRSVQSCMAAVAHANRGATLRDGRAAMYSAPLKVKEGAKASSKVSSLLNQNGLFLILVLGVPLLCLIVLIIVVDTLQKRAIARRAALIKGIPASPTLNAESKTEPQGDVISLQESAFDGGTNMKV